MTNETNMTIDFSINQLLNVLASILEPWIKVSVRLSNIAYDMLSDESIGLLGEVLEEHGIKLKKRSDNSLKALAKRIQTLTIAQKYTTVQEVCDFVKKGEIKEFTVFVSRIENLLVAKQYEMIHHLCNNIIEN